MSLSSITKADYIEMSAEFDLNYSAFQQTLSELEAECLELEGKIKGNPLERRAVEVVTSTEGPAFCERVIQHSANWIRFSELIAQPLFACKRDSVSTGLKRLEKGTVALAGRVELLSLAMAIKEPRVLPNGLTVFAPEASGVPAQELEKEEPEALGVPAQELEEEEEPEPQRAGPCRTIAKIAGVAAVGFFAFVIEAVMTENDKARYG